MRSLFGCCTTALPAFLPLAAAAVTNCISGDVCISIAVPEAAASSGSGDLFFQMTAPTSYSWVGMGTGSRMAGSTMFIMYTDGSGSVTISPRRGTGHNPPDPDSSIEVELLEGSGVSGSTMTGNFRISDLDVDPTENDSPWLAAWKSGSPLDDSDLSARISEHDSFTDWEFDLTQASVADESNPFETSDEGDGANGGDSSDGGDSGDGNGRGNNRNDGTTSSTTGTNTGTNTGVVSTGSGRGSTETILIIHAIVASFAFVVLMPFASVLMPLLGKWYIHAGLQLLSFIVMWIGFGLGVKVANDFGIIFDQTHTILGTVVVCTMVLQPVFGWLHHLHFVKSQSRGLMSYVHIWYGRILMGLGVINGGLGLRLSNAADGYKIAYGAVAGIMLVIYVVGKIAGMSRKRHATPQAHQMTSHHVKPSGEA